MSKELSAFLVLQINKIKQQTADYDDLPLPATLRNHLNSERELNIAIASFLEQLTQSNDRSLYSFYINLENYFIDEDPNEIDTQEGYSDEEIDEIGYVVDSMCENMTEEFGERLVTIFKKKFNQEKSIN